MINAWRLSQSQDQRVRKVALTLDAQLVPLEVATAVAVPTVVNVHRQVQVQIHREIVSLRHQGLQKADKREQLNKKKIVAQTHLAKEMRLQVAGL